MENHNEGNNCLYFAGAESLLYGHSYKYLQIFPFEYQCSVTLSMNVSNIKREKAQRKCNKRYTALGTSHRH